MNEFNKWNLHNENSEKWRFPCVLVCVPSPPSHSPSCVCLTSYWYDEHANMCIPYQIKLTWAFVFRIRIIWIDLNWKIANGFCSFRVFDIAFSIELSIDFFCLFLHLRSMQSNVFKSMCTHFYEKIPIFFFYNSNVCEQSQNYYWNSNSKR